MKKYKKIEMIVVLILTCLLFSCGPRVKNGFVKEGENTYYYVNDKMQKGWQEINEDWYFFFQGSGVMAKDIMIIDVDGKEYGFDNNGKMYKNILTRVDAVRHRLDEKGRDVSRDNCNQTAYFGEDGAMLKNTQKEIDGNLYIIDENGIAKQQPDYQLVFDSSFPITIYSYGDAVIIEKIDYELYELKELPGSSYRRGGQVFETYWTGVAGNSYKGSNYSTPRYVGYKLYDPNGYVIETGSFSTGVALAMGERFKDKHMRLSSNITKKGIYKLKLLGESK